MIVVRWIERLIGYGSAFGFEPRPAEATERNTVRLFCAGCGTEISCFGLRETVDRPPPSAILEDVQRQLEAHECR